jgi:CRP-like cAMP-binding protein
MNRDVALMGQPLCCVAPLAAAEAPDAPPPPARAERRLTRIVQLRPGERLWSQDDPAHYLAVVCRGRLLAWRRHPRREILFDVLKPGDTVGELTLEGGVTQQLEVESLRRSVVVLLPLRAMQRRIAAHPDFALQLLGRFTDSVRRLTGRVEALSQLSVEHRLADVLVRLADRFGEPFDGGVLVPLKLSRDNLAAMAATTQESISRRLTTWRKSGILVPQPAGYLVRDPAALRRLLDRP